MNLPVVLVFELSSAGACALNELVAILVGPLDLGPPPEDVRFGSEADLSLDDPRHSRLPCRWIDAESNLGKDKLEVVGHL
jgi:hypothetical protein